MPMGLNFGREICGQLSLAESREWLVTNGIGGYAAGTIAGLLTRCYHGLLVAALDPPLGRTLLLTKLDETVLYGGGGSAQNEPQHYPLHTNRWSDGSVGPHGYLQIERFMLDGTIPIWRYACADALIEKRIWMQPGANTTYIFYHLLRATKPLSLNLKALVNYRDYHSRTQAHDWQMTAKLVDRGLSISAFPTAKPIFLLSDRADFIPTHQWYYGFDLAAERERGLGDRDDNLHIATLQASLEVGETLTIVASTEPKPALNGDISFKHRRTIDHKLLGLWKSTRLTESRDFLEFGSRLVLAADQFIVNRATPEDANGKTVIAGYPWFSDWGRDTMISLPGLTLATGRPEIARSILQVFAQHVDQGMIPNRFPDAGETPEYNTVDATLWYFEALRAYYDATEDDELIRELFPVLADIINWHCRGTRFNIHLDPADGLLFAGEPGIQLTWMDAKVGDWVVTPRIGKPVEINALWYNALRTIAKLARRIGKPHQEYEAIADRALARFSRFWNGDLGYCYDVLDGPHGHDISLRPNQLFAVSLPESPLTPAQQQEVVDVCAQTLLTSHGLRSLSSTDPSYQGKYRGDQTQRDGAYHQGTVWGWLLGPFVIAHLRVYNDPAKAREFLEPMMNQLSAHGVGSLSEIFDGDAPMLPNGCFAQAWTVAEVLRALMATEH